ncbi:uncharacterized protein [Phyllobates terribilis]|uniref:uncharacterized protein isoform X3 n=1 Tax=Phyllobates terribilis TaxID=111132 RepID=UPI003CCADB3C
MAQVLTTTVQANDYEDNVYGNVDEANLARPIEMDETSMDNCNIDDVYMNVSELKTEAKSHKSVAMNKTPKNKTVSTSNTKLRVILTALIILIIMFLILSVITGLLIKYFLDFKNDMEKQNNLMTNVADLNNTMVELQDLFKANVSLINKTLVELQDLFKANVMLINKTHENICKSCPLGWYTISSACYYVSGHQVSWDLAREECDKMSSVLLMIKDKTESESLKKLFAADQRYWIGLRRDAKEVQIWKWLDGTQVTFTNWDKNEPNNYGSREHCGETKSGPWNDRNCIDNLFYICKRIKTC